MARWSNNVVWRRDTTDYINDFEYLYTSVFDLRGYMLGIRNQEYFNISIKKNSDVEVRSISICCDCSLLSGV